MAKRSRKLTGPYKEERQLALPGCEAMEPNQGGIILGKDNNWYFLTHHGTGDWSGRIVSLLPVTWVDGWPIPGEVLPQDIGAMKWGGKMPFKYTENYLSSVVMTSTMNGSLRSGSGTISRGRNTFHSPNVRAGCA